MYQTDNALSLVNSSSYDLRCQPQHTLTKYERLLRAVFRQPVDRPPVWLMRQAGRYLPQYREIRGNVPFQEVCRNPELAAEISIQPFDILGVDAVIVFNDILIPFEHMGLPVRFTDSGVEIQPAIRSESDLMRLHRMDFDDRPPVYETLRAIRASVGPDVPVLGFVGGPFTMAAYAVEGKLSKNFIWIRTLRYENPDFLKRLLERLTDELIRYIEFQIDAGADVIQVFDTWAGVFTPSDYREFILPYQKRMVRAAQMKEAPAVLYVNGCESYVTEMCESQADVLSVDWRVDLKSVYHRTGRRCALQGNLDPAALCAPPERVAALTRSMLEDFGSVPGYIANLGHGILPNTPVESVQAFVETVQSNNCGAPAPAYPKVSSML
ncbi:MAG: uroporphyrinogen decarboxylase [bacterium]